MRKPNIYLAGPFGTKIEMRQRRSALLARGFTVNARWIDEDQFTSDSKPSDVGEAPSADYLRQYAEIDLADAKACDWFVVFPGQGAGHHTELGVALALNKPIIVIGPKNNIFHYLPDVYHLDTWADFLTELEEAFDKQPDGGQGLPQDSEDGTRLRDISRGPESVRDVADGWGAVGTKANPDADGSVSDKHCDQPSAAS